jgi:hypothetical protein
MMGGGMMGGFGGKGEPYPSTTLRRDSGQGSGHRAELRDDGSASNRDTLRRQPVGP